MLKVVRGCAAVPQDQDDLFQDVLLQVWSSIPAFRGEAKETTWIYRVAFNTALAWRRGERRRREGHETFLKFDISPQVQPSHLDALPEQEIVAQLYAAIRQLPKMDASLALIGLVVGGLYWLTWVAVRKDLEPRRQELETLLANLK